MGGERDKEGNLDRRLLQEAQAIVRGAADAAETADQERLFDACAKATMAGKLEPVSCMLGAAAHEAAAAGLSENEWRRLWERHLHLLVVVRVLCDESVRRLKERGLWPWPEVKDGTE